MLQRSARLQYALLALVAFFALTHFYLGVARSFDNLAHGEQRSRIPFLQGSLGHANVITAIMPPAQPPSPFPYTLRIEGSRALSDA